MKHFEQAVQLRAGKWQAAVLPGFGMNMISLRCGEDLILREPDCMETLEKRPYTYGNPLLLPANRTRDGKFTFEGVTYTLPLNETVRSNNMHGQLYNAPFRVTEQTESSVTAVYENRGERYPFPFDLTITEALTENGLTRTMTLCNTGSKAMPYTLALHTTFREPAWFSVPLGERFVSDERYLPTGEMVPLTEEERSFTQKASSRGIRVSGFYTSVGQTVHVGDYRFDVSEQFDLWVTFNGNGMEEYLCLEPQCGQVDGLNSEGHRVLQPGEREIFTVRISRA